MKKADLLTTLTRAGGNRQILWYEDRLEFLSFKKDVGMVKVDELKFITIDGEIVRRGGMARHYMELAEAWLDNAQLPPQPR